MSKLSFRAIPVISMACWAASARAEALPESASDLVLWPYAVLATALIALAWWLRGRREQRRLAGMLDDLRRDGDTLPDVAGAGSALEAARASLKFLCDALVDERRRTVSQSSARQRAEAELRASEERHALALMGADEGWWEWDLKSGKVLFSERWRCMLGLAPADVGDSIDDWCRRIHPADRERAQMDLEAHLAGRTPRFENEHRLLHRDGTYRWVLARATALRHAGGRPHRMVGLATDVSARRQVQQAVIELADSMAVLRGDECLRELARRFAQVLSVSEVFICECVDHPTTTVRMLARWKAGRHDNCVEFPLEGTACADVIQSGRLVYAPVDAGARWPIERQYDRNSYLGMPCIDRHGTVVGHIACADPGRMPDALPHEALLRLFAVRAAIELEWRAIERARGFSFGALLGNQAMIVH